MMAHTELGVPLRERVQRVGLMHGHLIVKGLYETQMTCPSPRLPV